MLPTAARAIDSGGLPERPSFRALAVDLDGTLARAGRPSEEVLTRLATVRQQGCRLVLVTGRIIAELKRVFADVEEQFDRIAAENGAVLAAAGHHRPLAPPVEDRVRGALASRGAPFRRGAVILVGSARDEVCAAEEIRRLGLDHQLVRNRGELMIIPAGASKGRGLLEALAEIGVSRHDTLAVGDAENDLSLLRPCAVGAAVANAVESLRRQADLVLSAENGSGVLELLDGPVFWGTQVLHPARWHVTVGRGADGKPVQIPSSRLNVLISGPTGAGKSYVAGLLAEQLIQAAYTVLVIDPEGDYEALRAIPGVVTLGHESLPDAERIVEMLHHRFGSVIVDLSTGEDERKALYPIAPLLHAHRLQTGLPHWVLIDEAHDLFGAGGALLHVADPATKGYLLVTYHPELLDNRVLADIDVEILLPGSTAPASLPLPEPSLLEALAHAGHGHALVLTKTDASLVALADRQTSHLRHWHKYIAGRLPPDKQFYFREQSGSPTGIAAGNLIELHRELDRCAQNTVRHHAIGHDFSRWVRDVFADEALASEMADIEAQVVDSADAAAGAEQARAALMDAVQRHYLE